MNVPMQVKPVQRAIATYSVTGRNGQAEALTAQPFGGGNGIAPSELGVDASGFWDVFKDVVKTVGPPLLGML